MSGGGQSEADPGGEPDAAEDCRLVRGLAETESIGAELATLTEPGDLWLLQGEVGAGKSTLVRSILRSLGVEGAIPSPTFTLGRFYESPAQQMPVSHLDLYRLGDLADEDPGLLADYFGPDRAAFVEWPGGAEEELAAMATRTGRVTIEHLDTDSRRVRIEAPR